MDTPFTEWVGLKVTMGEFDAQSSVEVQFLVTTDRLGGPILGFNAIKIITSGTNEDVFRIFSSTFNTANPSQIEVFVSLLHML